MPTVNPTVVNLHLQAAVQAGKEYNYSAVASFDMATFGSICIEELQCSTCTGVECDNFKTKEEEAQTEVR